MKKQFFVGNFLRAYSDAFRYPDGFGRTGRKADPDWLADRFAQRSRRSRERRSTYVLRMQIAAILALLIVIGATTVNFRAGNSLDFAVADQETVDLQEITQTVHEVLPPPPPRPAVPIAVPDDQVLVDDELDLDAALDLTDAVTALPPPPEKEEEDEAEPEIFVVVEEWPEMIGGAVGLARAVRYPSIARQAGIEGMVVVRVVVTANGVPENPEVLKSPASVLDQAAIEAVMKQRFKPARQRGRAVATFMAIPVRFRLTSSAI